MAREAIIILDMSSYSNRIYDIVEFFEKAGWHIGYDLACYLPVGDDDEFDYKTAALSKDELRSIVDRKQSAGEMVGLKLYFEDTDTGITFLADDPTNIILSLDINRKTVLSEYTDASWYIENIIARLENCGFIAEAFDYNEVIG